MRKQIKSLLLVVVFACTTLSAWSQASTEGKDFWVANTIVCQPPTASSAAFPTIAVSAQKACKVTITDYAGNQLATANVAAGSWTCFGDKNAAVDPADYYLDPSKWYPTTNHVNATDVYKHADKTNNYGLHITATENISVYIIMRTPEFSMDASNALPITALQAEYYLQDFYPDANGVDKPVTMTTILATENNTQVVITPKGNTYGKNNNGTPFTVSLNKGQTYYLISEVNSQLAGTHILAQDGKKIAVYVGSPVTRLPDGVSARDGLFEQMMPIDYWGTQFIVTRSMQKDANVIGITATQNGTELKIDGYTQAFINEGDTYYILLQGASNPYAADQSKISFQFDQIITANEAYIETSCPCAVISYDTGNSFAGSSNSEITNKQGDPSSVWISPVQQKINRITFGACYTSKTKAHFLNVVTETATCQNTKLTAYSGSTAADWTDKLSWTSVPGNPTYSYARVQIGNNTETIKVFTLENDKGFIAHVYGNGTNESYAYSAGSAAVEQGVIVDGETFTNGYRSNSKFCIDTDLSFDAKVGTDEISRVDWDFGDGTTEYYGSPQTTHPYTTPGWYDVTATLWGHQVCTTEDNVEIGTVHFTFRIVRPDTIIKNPEHHCFDLDGRLDGKGDPYTEEQIADSIAMGGTRYEQADCTSDVYVIPVSYGSETLEVLDTITDYDQATGYNGTVYYTSTDVSDTIEAPENSKKCTIYRNYYVRVITCLDLKFHNDSAAQHICPTNSLTIDYEKIKGDIKSVRFVVPGYVDDTIVMSNANTRTGSIMLPTEAITTPGIYKGQIIVEDLFCETKTHTIDITVYYPEDIIKYKFNNVLAVYNSGYGGNEGYSFKAYQWYRNYQKIEGATDNVLYLGDGIKFEIGDQVYVELTNMSGLTLPSCPLTIYNVPDYEVHTNNAPARKMLQDNRFVIIKGDDVYDIYGQKVK